MLNILSLFGQRGALLKKAASPAVLNHAWRQLRNEKGCWVRGVPVEHIQADAVRHIGELSHDLLSGRYVPDPMRCFEIPKADGGKRLISAPSVRDKLAQRAVLTVLEPLGEAVFHEASFGFRPKCTREMALAQIRHWVRRGWVWIGDADIKTCFDTIPHRGALNALKQICKDKAIVRLISLWIDSIPLEFRANGRTCGLPQGMVLSPFICNLYLHQLDATLARQGVPFVRFADDFVTFGKTRAEAKQSLSLAGETLTKLALELHAEKTKVIRSSPRHRFLGYRLPDSKERFKG